MGLAELGLKQEDLPHLKHSDARRAAIARAVCPHTMAPLSWLARELHMSTPMNVSRLTQPR
jgi:hypothetical protein